MLQRRCFDDNIKNAGLGDSRETMIVLIPELPAQVTPASLYRYLTSCMEKVWLLPVFRRRGRLEKCEILRIRDPANDEVEYQGLAYVDNEMTGEALIKLIANCRLQGQALSPRVYFSRSNRKERRMRSTQPGELAIVDRRRADRRREHLVIERVHDHPLASPPLSS